MTTPPTALAPQGAPSTTTTLKHRLAASGANPAWGSAPPHTSHGTDEEYVKGHRGYRGGPAPASAPAFPPPPAPLATAPSPAAATPTSISDPVRAARRCTTRVLRRGASLAWARRAGDCAAVVCDALRAVLVRRLAACFRSRHARRRHHVDEDRASSASDASAEAEEEEEEGAGVEVDVTTQRRRAPRRRRRRHAVRVVSAAHVLRRAALLTCLALTLVVLLWVTLDAAIGLIVRLAGSNSVVGGGDGDMPADFQIPWLDCDCAGVTLLGDAAPDAPPVAAQLRAMRAVVDVGCSLCDSAYPLDAFASVQLNVSSGDLMWRGDDGGLVHAIADLPILATAVKFMHAIAVYGAAALHGFATTLCPNTMLSIASGWASYTAYRERQAVAQRRARQNRGIAGGSVQYAGPRLPPTPPAAWIGVARGPWADFATDAHLVDVGGYTPTYLVQRDAADGQRACAERAPLRRLFFPRAALPWWTIDAAAHRTREAWALDPRGRDALLPFAVATSPAARARLRAAVRGTLSEFDVPADEVAEMEGGGGGVEVCRIADAAGNGTRTDPARRGDEKGVPPCAPPPSRHVPEITVAVTDERKWFQSFLCSDVPNASGPAMTTPYYLDPVRAALLAVTAEERQDGEKNDRAAPVPSPPPSRCVGCVFHCVHPRLARAAQASRSRPRGGGEDDRRWDGDKARHFPAAERAAGATAASPPPLSWGVALEDVDAGLVHVDVPTPAAPAASPRRVTRADLFTCKVLSRERDTSSTAADAADAAAAAAAVPGAPDGAATLEDRRTNKALLLSTDVWLTHFGDGLPLFFVQNVSEPAALRRLLPLHTAAVYGESLQSFPDYAMRPTYWLQFDAVYLQNPVRRPALLPQSRRARTAGGVAGDGEDADGVDAVDRRRGAGTVFDTWTVTHTYLRDFQLVVHLNQLLRLRQTQHHAHLQRAQPGEGGAESTAAPFLLKARDVPAVAPYAATSHDHAHTRDAVHPTNNTTATTPQTPMTRGVVARLAYELLHGADPLLLPLHGEHLETELRDFALAWRPPTAADWARAGRGVHDVPATHLADGVDAVRAAATAPLRLSFAAATGRLPAIAVSISHCWHARLWWLSELSRYYPVHNYGRCVIPPPVPRLPGDVEPSATAGTPAMPIPQRAQLSFPPECAAARIALHHDEALRSLWRTAEARGDGTVDNPRRTTHVGRDHELRCVFRKYRYVLAFENTIEDDYVTEKVYNALLSGALPLYIGAMNVADYVPRVAVNATVTGAAAAAAATASSSSVHGLSVLPVLQMFPLLNETAWRAEEQRMVQLRNYDEAVARQVLRLHARVLRARAGATTTTTTTTANAAPQVASQQRPVDPPPHHGISSAAAATAAATVLADALEAAAALSPRDVAQAHFLLYDTNASASAAASSSVRAATMPFPTSAGVWPPPLSSSSARARLGYGQESYLRRVHELARGIASPDAASTAAKADGVRDAARTSAAAPAPRGRHDALRRVRYRTDQDWALTANTAWGFSESVNHSSAPHRRRDDAGGTASATRRVVQMFEGVNGSTSSPTAPGGVFSRYFPRRSLPRTPAYERVRTADPSTRHRERGDVEDGRASTASAPPLNGFAQLAAYLRTLDADPSLIDEAGYFHWWRAASMEELGAAFLEKVYKPHPICGICAAALEKKEAMRA